MKNKNYPHFEGGIELSKEMLVYFIGEKLPMKVKAVSKNFAICTRKLNRRQDADLLHRQVETGAYISFTEAYNDQKSEVIYTIVDFKQNIRGAHNLVLGGCDFKDEKEIEDFIAELESGEVEISYRNRCNYNLDFERTLKNKVSKATNNLSNSFKKLGKVAKSATKNFGKVDQYLKPKNQ
jgi:hypothetical protein